VLRCIDHQTPSDLAHLLRGLVRDHGASFQHRARFREGDEYNRELVHAAPGYEIWLLSWLPGQITPIHDHGGALTVTTVLSGTVLEEQFERIERSRSERRSEDNERTRELEVRPTRAALREIGDIDPIDPVRIHRVRPMCKALTLHLYVPTFTDGQIYTTAAGTPTLS
jgi:predicted metal-dependent enzyme (double-stranded beta helix superfamily)